MSLLATQLLRHPSLKPIDRAAVWARHPGVYDPKTRRTVVPAAHDSSVFMNPVKNAYGDKLLPDGRTIEFHPSSSNLVNGRLQKLTGAEATLYVFLGNDTYRTGTVAVDRVAEGVYHLRLVTPPLPCQPPPRPPPAEQPSRQPKKMLWADMTD